MLSRKLNSGDGSYFPHWRFRTTLSCLLHNRGMEECNHTLLDAIDIIGVALISYMALTPVFVFLTVLFDEKRIMVAFAGLIAAPALIFAIVRGVNCRDDIQRPPDPP